MQLASKKTSCCCGAGKCKVSGRWTGHAPRLPQPPAKALAVPTTLGLNMQELQNWQHTKQASAKPMAQRVTMNVAESVTIDMQNTARKHAMCQMYASSMPTE